MTISPQILDINQTIRILEARVIKLEESNRTMVTVADSLAQRVIALEQRLAIQDEEGYHV